MCAPSQGAMLPYGLKVPSPYFPFGPNGGLTQAHLSALDFQRSQLNDYNVQVQFGLRNYQNSIGLSPFHTYISDPYTQAYFYKHDHRARFVQEEPKPSHSYIGLIGMAILNSKEKKLVLSDIYQWILDNYPYFRTRGPGWRNSIRHNLSLNDCFIKAGRSANGKGHYWAVHPANVEDFERGDFRRRRAQRKVRRHMGLSVPDDEDSPTPSPTQPWHHHDIAQELERNNLDPISPTDEQTLRHNFTRSESEHPVFCHPTPAYGLVQVQHRKQSRKRLFDMASLLAPDDDDDDVIKNEQKIKNERISNKNIHASGFDFRAIHELTLHEGQVNSVLDHMKTKESYSYDDVNVDMNSSPSSSGREMNDDSDDDAENDEIQVTSDDDSPTHEHGSHSNLGQVKSAICIDENTMRTNTNIKSTVYSEKDENESLNWSSSQFKTESKTDNAIDMSTFTNSNCEKKLEIFSSKNNAFQTPTINSARKESGNSKQSDRRGLIKIEAGLVDCNGYDDFKSLISSCRSGISRIDKKEGNHDNHRDIDEIKNKLPYQDDYIHRRELVSSEPNHTERTSNTFNCYRPEQLDDRRHQLQPNRDSNSMESMDNDLVETELHINAEKRGRIYQVPISESVNVHGDAVGWAEMPKSVLLRDRLSAFSALCIRNNSIYSPVQLRQSLVSNNRLLPKTETVRTDTQSSMISVSSATSSSSTSLTKRSAIGSTKGNYPIINNNCTSSHAKDDSK